MSAFSPNSERRRGETPSHRRDRLLHLESSLWSRGITRVAGIDEAGRGPLAGPVVAAAVVFPSGFYLDGVDDSKKLRPAVRSALYGRILDGALSVGVGIIDHEAIDRVNILNATFDAMAIAVKSLDIPPEFLLVDGNRFRGEGIPHSTVVHGDELSFAIAAASIIAKVTRDRIMERYDARYPLYGFSRHKGYGTREHRSAILRHGLCPIHRRSFTRKLLKDHVNGCSLEVQTG